MRVRTKKCETDRQRK